MKLISLNLVMLKVITLYLFYISFITDFQAESISLGGRKKSIKDPSEKQKCNSSYDCPDFRMICSKELECQCAKFHDWVNSSRRCVVNISRITNWLEATASTDPGYVSQQEDFEKEEGKDVLHPKWAEYEAEKQTGINHITRVIWPIMLGSLLILVIYGAILMEFL